MGALAHLVRQGKTLYVGISSYSAPSCTRKAAAILRSEERVPLLIHQPSPIPCSTAGSKRNSSPRCDSLGVGCIAFSALAQGMLTTKYLNGVPKDARAARGGSLSQELLSADNLARIRALNDIAGRRGQTLAQMAIAWVLRDRRVTSALIGARTVAQLDDSLDAVNRLDFGKDELAEIDRHATEGGIDIWNESSTLDAAG